MERRLWLSEEMPEEGIKFIKTRNPKTDLPSFVGERVGLWIRGLRQLREYAEQVRGSEPAQGNRGRTRRIVPGDLDWSAKPVAECCLDTLDVAADGCRIPFSSNRRDQGADGESVGNDVASPSFAILNWKGEKDMCVSHRDAAPIELLEEGRVILVEPDQDRGVGDSRKPAADLADLSKRHASCPQCGRTGGEHGRGWLCWGVKSPDAVLVIRVFNRHLDRLDSAIGTNPEVPCKEAGAEDDLFERPAGDHDRVRTRCGAWTAFGRRGPIHSLWAEIDFWEGLESSCRGSGHALIYHVVTYRPTWERVQLCAPRASHATCPYLQPKSCLPEEASDQPRRRPSSVTQPGGWSVGGQAGAITVGELDVTVDRARFLRERRALSA